VTRLPDLVRFLASLVVLFLSCGCSNLSCSGGRKFSRISYHLWGWKRPKDGISIWSAKSKLVVPIWKGPWALSLQLSTRYDFHKKIIPGVKSANLTRRTERHKIPRQALRNFALFSAKLAFSRTRVRQESSLSWLYRWCDLLKKIARVQTVLVFYRNRISHSCAFYRVLRDASLRLSSNAAWREVTAPGLDFRSANMSEIASI
jgi:hypothetical protein